MPDCGFLRRHSLSIDSAMTNGLIQPVLAIDGGGTRCRLALNAGDRLVQIEVGSTNVSTDFAAATAELRLGLGQLAEAAGVPLTWLADVPTYAGLAGVTGATLAARVQEALPLKSIKVEDDRPAALRGAIGEANGVVAHCGTGSFVARQQNGQMRLAGGWGAVLGDPASAQWVGRRALGRTLDVADRLVAGSGLSDAVMQRFGDTSAIVAFAATATPSDFGALAPMVTEASSRGDEIARGILSAAATEIADTLRAMGWCEGETICLTGGIGPRFADYMPLDMIGSLAPPQATPLDGALSLANDFRNAVSKD